MMTETKRILSSFTPYVDQGADAVTLIFAQEYRSRSVNLDEILTGDTASYDANNHQLTIDLDPEAVPVQTVAVVNWSPFRYRNGEYHRRANGRRRTRGGGVRPGGYGAQPG